MVLKYHFIIAYNMQSGILSFFKGRREGMIADRRLLHLLHVGLSWTGSENKRKNQHSKYNTSGQKH